MSEKGIIHRLTCPYTSHQNGTVERKHRSIVEMGLTILAHANILVEFWDHSFTQAVYLLNRLPTSNFPTFTSPFHALFNIIPDYQGIRVFGCLCFPHLRPFNKHKLQLRSSECVYLGVSPQHKGHKCLSKEGKIYISKDVVFDEAKYPFTSLFPSGGTSQSSTSCSDNDISMSRLMVYRNTFENTAVSQSSPA